MKSPKHNSIPVEWIRHLKTKEEKEAFKGAITAAQPVLDVLKNFCQRKLDEAQSVKEDDYDVPSWPYKQADKNGYQRALEDILKLLP